jgi:hypothetical protein
LISQDQSTFRIASFQKTIRFLCNICLTKTDSATRFSTLGIFS